MRILVTGAGGFVGSYLCERLIADGHEVTGLVHYNSSTSHGWLDEVPGCSRVRSDVRDPESMMQFVQGHSVVFHLAALISVPYSFTAPRQFIETNVLGTLNVALACLRHGAHLIHTSTSEVYGTAQTEFQDESHPQVAHSPYAASKIAADKLVESLVLSQGLHATILRPFNTYGPRQSERAVIPRIIAQALDPTCDKLLLGNTGAVRDLTYVTDTVDAFVRALDLLLLGPFNVASSIERSLTEICRLVTKKPIASMVEAVRPESAEVHRLCGDSTRFRQLTNWQPQVSFVEGIHLVETWMRGRKSRGYCV